MVPNIDQNIISIQYKIYLVRAITEIGQYWWKSIFFMPENAWFQRYFTEVSLTPLKENQLSHLQNDYFSKNLWWFHEPHNQVKYRFFFFFKSELFIIKIFEYKIVTFLPTQSLVCVNNLTKFTKLYKQNQNPLYIHPY